LASAVAVRRVRWTITPRQVMRPPPTGPRKCTFISVVAILTPDIEVTASAMVLSIKVA